MIPSRRDLIAVVQALAGAFLTTAANAQTENTEASRPRVQRTPNDHYLQLGLGVDYSDGTYGDTRSTRILALPVSAKYVSGPFALRIAVPYVFLRGPGSLIDLTGGGGDVQTGAADRSVEGFGDLTVAATYSFALKRDDLYFDVSGKVKVPTGSTAKLLGTGRTDLTAAASLAKILGPVTLYAQGRRRFTGRSIVFPGRDLWGTSAGVVVRAGKPVYLGLDYDWQQSSYRFRRPISALTGSATIRLARSLRLQIYGDVGLTSNSLSRGGGMQLLWRIFD